MGLKEASKRSEHMSPGKAVHSLHEPMQGDRREIQSERTDDWKRSEIPWVRNMELAAYTVETIETIKEMTGS